MEFKKGVLILKSKKLWMILLMCITVLVGCDHLSNKNSDSSDIDLSNKNSDSSDIDLSNNWGVVESNNLNDINNDSNFEITYKGGLIRDRSIKGEIYEIIDKDTGVYYLAISQYGYGLTITPLYNGDGALKTSELVNQEY